MHFTEECNVSFNVYNWAAPARAFTLIGALALSTASSFAVSTETAVKNFLLSSEKDMLGVIQNPNKKQALLLKDLELKRGDYARTVQLLSEKILARKEMEEARIHYEKILIELASNGRSASGILASINRQRSQLNEMTSERGIAATGTVPY